MKFLQRFERRWIAAVREAGSVNCPSPSHPDSKYLLSPDRSSSELTDVVLTELHHLVDERRFIMSSYMRALSIYLAAAGYGMKELIDEPNLALALALWLALSSGNWVACFMAGRFRSMFLHSYHREKQLRAQLGMEQPHSLLWGYWGGIVLFVMVQLADIAVIGVRLMGVSDPLQL